MRLIEEERKRVERVTVTKNWRVSEASSRTVCGANINDSTHHYFAEHAGAENIPPPWN